MRAHCRDSISGASPTPLRRKTTARRRKLQSAAAGFLLVLGLCGCASSATEYASAHASRTAHATPPTSSTISDETAAPHDQEGTSSRSPSAGTNALALAAMRSFCQPKRSQQAWIADLDPYLTLAAASAYATVQPSRVACTRVTAAARAGEGDGFTRLVAVPTDAGVYRVTVTRALASERWLVFRIAPTAAR